MRNTAILIFDDAEVLDFCGPFEVFSVTNELNNYELFNVYTVAGRKRMIRAKNGLRVQPDYGFHSCPAPDILLIPGGSGTRKVMHHGGKPLRIPKFWRQNASSTMVRSSFPRASQLGSICVCTLWPGCTVRALPVEPLATWNTRGLTKKGIESIGKT